MITLKQFHKSNPVVAEGVRALNRIPPKSDITYLTYRSWVMNLTKMGSSYKLLLFLKGIKP